MTGPRQRRPRRWPDRPARLAFALGLVGLAWRAVLVGLGVPGGNSDEATFGLAAMHVAAGREHPLFLYGQHYMGTVESYLAAPLFAVLGPGWVTLRVPLLALYALFTLALYALTRRLYGRWFAVFVVGLLAFGSERVVRDQVTAVGGRPEVKPAVVALLLLTVGLAGRGGRAATLRLGLSGLVAGLAAWDDWLVAPYLAAVVGVLLAGHGRRLLGAGGVLALAGFAVGLLPLVLDNLTAPPGADSLSVLRQLQSGDGAGVPPLADRVHGAVAIGLPLAGGLCRPERCGSTWWWWGPVYLGLLLTSGALAVAGLRRGRRAPGPDQATTRYAAQLALVAGALLTVLAYVRNPLAGTAPVPSARYLSVLQISLPAVVWPLWSAAGRLAGAHRAARLFGALAAAGLAGLVAALLAATVSLAGQVHAIRAEEIRARRLAESVHRAGVRYVYAEYWTCNRLVFTTGERVICAVLADDLRPGQNRYPPYAAAVDAAPKPDYLFVADGPADTAFAAYLRGHGLTATVTRIGAHRLYRTTMAVRPRR